MLNVFPYISRIKSIQMIRIKYVSMLSFLLRGFDVRNCIPIPSEFPIKSFSRRLHFDNRASVFVCKMQSSWRHHSRKEKKKVAMIVDSKVTWEWCETLIDLRSKPFLKTYSEKRCNTYQNECKQWQRCQLGSDGNRHRTDGSGGQHGKGQGRQRGVHHDREVQCHQDAAQDHGGHAEHRQVSHNL